MDIALEQIDESTLIKACVKKEKWAQRVIYEKFYSDMLHVCMRYAKDDKQAEDILHDSFIKVFRYIHRYKVGTSLNAWIKRIVINSSIDQYRKNVRRRHKDLSQQFDLEANASNPISKFGEEDILKCVQQLPDHFRLVFNLYVLEGYSHKEVSEQLGISSSTSRANLSKGRKLLRKILRKKGISYGE